MITSWGAIVFSLITARMSLGLNLFNKFFLYVILKLHAKFQCPTMPGTGKKVCGGGWVGGTVCKPILVFSLVSS